MTMGIETVVQNAHDPITQPCFFFYSLTPELRIVEISVPRMAAIALGGVALGVAGSR
ncbi:hypothetical protein VTJ83DRAFT_6939 [Remersonia thermophila]|uniref:Uncharacterized protein n=1 Tax=Remersonia thermophila TaxID=72144 RepID=A0ABR4D648_9PEZI